MKLAILDLVSVSTGQRVADALEASMRAAELADRLGYERLWFAEHHNTVAVAASATSVLIGQALARTQRIHVGSGGVMLPNHSPLTVAEHFGTLATMYPGRVDLGLGRAPGTDQLTAQMLARSSAEPQEFMHNIRLLHQWFDTGAVSGIVSGVAQGTRVPMWLLSSSTTGAAMAGMLGLPYSFAAHFAPGQLDQALATYREHFDPSAPTACVERPYVQIGVNVLAHERPGEAQRLFTSTQQMFLALRRAGGRAPLPAPQALDANELELKMLDHALSVRAVGTPDVVAERLQEIHKATDADELITVTYAHDPDDRLHSLELVAQAVLGG